MLTKNSAKTVFLEDLKTSKAVFATAGFTLMTESIYLKKPYLALPMQGQFEQELNGLLLEMAGWGMNLREIREDAVAAFLYRLPEYRDRLMAIEHWDGDLIKNRLKELLDNNCEEAVKYHLKRAGM